MSVDLRHPFVGGATMTLCRVTLQANPINGRLMHVSVGYLTQPPSGASATYRERWLSHLDAHPLAVQLLDLVVTPLTQRHGTDFVDAAVVVRTVYIDLDAAGSMSVIHAAYDVLVDGFEQQRRVRLNLLADSFWNRAVKQLLGEIQPLLA